MKRDWLPLLLIPALMIGALPLIGSPASWVTLTVAGLAMGMMEFGLAMITANSPLGHGYHDLLHAPISPSLTPGR